MTEMSSGKKTLCISVALVLLALAVRLIPAWSALDFPDRITRPDTMTYLDPAQALLEGRFSGTGRAPGYILLAAAAKWCSLEYHTVILALAGVFFSTLTLLPLYAGTKELFGPKPALIAAVLYAFNLTSIANAPMLLSDTFFAFFAACQYCFFARFYRKKKNIDFLLCIFFAAAGTLIRPINLPWMAPALVLLWFLPGVPRKTKALNTLAAVTITLLILLPWMARNAAAGAPWCIDTNTGAMVHQNGAMILSEARGTSYEAEKNKIRQEYDLLFRDREKFPDEKSREQWKMARLRQIIAAHPFIALKQHFNWHRILLPDAPTFFELLGMTKSDRGTMDVLARKGLLAAVDHYFEGRWSLPCLLLPLLLVTGATYLGTVLLLLLALFRFRRRWYLWLLFLAFAEFYLFLPGPICAPRYQLPALPLLCGFAGIVIYFLYQKVKSRFRSTLQP
jgi:4-amino-4-deoxy-L-arabinose transferase-like glycosyltransferase